MPTDILPNDTAERWLTNPLVALAAERSDGDTTSLLEQLSRLLVELEDRFPTVPFDQILSPPSTRDHRSRKRFRTRLINAGCTVADVELVCAQPTSADRYASWQKWFDLADECPTRQALEAAGFDSPDIQRVLALSKPLSAEHHAIAVRVVDGGESLYAVATSLGIGHSGVRCWAMALAYQRRCAAAA